MATPLNNLSLCSGIGGLDLGVSRALGTRTLAYCERDPFAASVLLERMETKDLEPAPVWCGDLRDMDCSPFRELVDVITAGYPCQPFSLAGKRRGQDDPRHLWPAVSEVIRNISPALVVLENVRGHVRRGLNVVLEDLSGLGFDARWGTLPASAVGAPHRRDRLFIVAAHPDRVVVRSEQGRGEPQRASASEPGDHGQAGPTDDADGRTVRPCGEPWGPSPEPAVCRMDDGAAHRVDRLRALGNAVVPQQAEHAVKSLLEGLAQDWME